MRTVLNLAGYYNLAWGVAAGLFPNVLFDLVGMTRPLYPQFWQCIGMIVGVYGLGYLIAARDPYRHWPIVLVGLLGKLFGPLGFLGAALAGDLPWTFGGVLLTNDLVWWGPFALILRAAYNAWNDTLDARETPTLADALREARSPEGVTLAELSQRKPVLVVFLRHLG
jgi:hypothetical protein